MQQMKQQAHPCEVAQEFMKRTDMKGGEVDAYAQTFNWLAKILEGTLQVVLQTDLDSSKAKQEELETEIKDLHTELDDAYARLGVDRGEDALDKAKPAEPDESNGDEMVSEGGPVDVEEQPEGSPPDELDPVDSEPSD